MDKATPTPSPASVDSAPPLRFRFIEFNARRAMRGAAQAVRMLTEPEIKALTAMVWGAPCSGRDLAIVTSIVRAMEALNPGERPVDPVKGGRLLDVDACIPADGVIGDV